MPMMHLLLAAAAMLPSCWDTYDKALAHSAAAAHPPYITYSERIAISADGAPLITSFANIDYRDDGVARVADERFDYNPIVTSNPEPGPPELGPYGARRAVWLPLDSGDQTIAAVRAAGRVTCTMESASYRSRPAYHLDFRGASPKRPHLDDLWIDAQTSDIWDLRITAPIAGSGEETGSETLGDFDIELAYRQNYLVVDHVTWTYENRTHGQSVRYVGEYVLTDFAFPRTLPASYFART